MMPGITTFLGYFDACMHTPPAVRKYVYYYECLLHRLIVIYKDYACQHSLISSYTCMPKLL